MPTIYLIKPSTKSKWQNLISRPSESYWKIPHKSPPPKTREKKEILVSYGPLIVPKEKKQQSKSGLLGI
jgi:hypothetical protein